MKATIIVAAVLCVVVGGIVGWAMRGAFARPAAPIVLDITPTELADSGSNRLALISGNKMTVVEYWEHTGEIQIKASRKIK